MRAFGPSMLAPIIPRMLLLLLTFAQPLLVTDMISFSLDPEIPKSRGWALVGGFVCVYGLMVITTAIYWEQVHSVCARPVPLTHLSSSGNSGARSTGALQSSPQSVAC